jgi:HAD superfamily hydrolase (TIGR01509 family)
MGNVLLCDIDGTLVDSNALHAEAWRRAFEHFGIEIGMDDAWRQIGKGGDQLIPIFIAESDRACLEPEVKAYRKSIFHRDYMPRIVAFAQTRDLLLRVKESGRKIVLATSSDKADITIYKRIVGMADLVEDEATSSDAKQSKPAPDIFVAALHKSGVGPDAAMALGDTPWDARAAGALGIPVVGLTCGGWKRKDLLDAGCVEVYRDPADLLLHFDASILGCH